MNIWFNDIHIRIYVPVKYIFSNYFVMSESWKRLGLAIKIPKISGTEAIQVIIQPNWTSAPRSIIFTTD